MKFCQRCGSKLSALESPAWTNRFRCEAVSCGLRYEIFVGDAMGGSQDVTRVYDQPFTDHAEKLAVEEVAVLSPELRDVMVKLVGDLRVTVSRVHSLYEANPELNNLQPDSFSEVIPMSLDEWVVALDSCRDDWRKAK